ncbi:MAG: M14 family zinc carboxypeptidase [Bacteroidota bacterium]
MYSDPLSQVVFPDDEDDMWLYSRFLKGLEERQPSASTRDTSSRSNSSRIASSLPASSRIIGTSEAGRPIYGFVFGDGAVTVSLVAGAHADEPVGPNTLYRLVFEMLDAPGRFEALFSRFRFLIVPHINPDGDAANAGWITRWPDPEPFLTGMQREKPGRDIEFGYPGMRPENRAAVRFWERETAPDLHFSLHGMQFSEGFLLLVNDEWEDGSRSWREKFKAAMREEGLPPHDHDRKGEKGFNYMGPGFTSTPKGKAMREHFLALGDPETAGRFHLSSMEFQLGRNERALCMVTEFPLYMIKPSCCNGVPEHYLQLKQEWASLKEDKLEIEHLVSRFGVRPLSLGKAMRLQRQTIRRAMDLVGGSRKINAIGDK